MVEEWGMVFKFLNDYAKENKLLAVTNHGIHRLLLF